MGSSHPDIWDAQSSIRKNFPAVLSTARPSSFFGDGLFIYDLRLQNRGDQYVGQTGSDDLIFPASDL
jgi:hypothetical protein